MVGDGVVLGKQARLGEFDRVSRRKGEDEEDDEEDEEEEDEESEDSELEEAESRELFFSVYFDLFLNWLYYHSRSRASYRNTR